MNLLLNTDLLCVRLGGVEAQKFGSLCAIRGVIMDTGLDALPIQLPELHVVISMYLSISACSLVSAAGSPSNCLTSSWSGADFDVA